MKGPSALSNAELLAIIIGSGTKSLTAVDLAKQILKQNNNDLSAVARLNVRELTQFNGIGQAKAIAIISALELGRRKTSQTSHKQQIHKSEDVYHLMTKHLADLSHEEFWVLLLSRSNKVISREAISKGGLSGTVADPKVIFKKALDHKASNLILVHNHPSGNKQPSEADRQLTRKLLEAGKFLDITVLDHLIFSDEGYFSFADEGEL